jgi:hypothetical protein
LTGAFIAARAPALRLAAWGLAAAAIVAYGLRFCAGGNDFIAFYDVGARALARGDIYAPSATNGMYVFYAPHFSLLMMPIALLPQFTAGFLWFAVKVGVLAWVVREGWSEIRATAAGAPPSRWWPLYLALPLVIGSNPIIGEMKLGQVNLFVFALTLLAQRSMESGRPWRAAALFSVALVKVAPWVFVPWFLFRRQWKLLGALAVVGAGWLAALALWFGPGRLVGLFEGWLHASRTYKLGVESVAYFENQSLQGVAARLATVFPAMALPLHGVPLYRIAWLPAAATLFALALASAWRDRFRPVLPRAEFAFMCLVTYLCSPDSRWAHQMQLLAPFAALGALAARVDLFGPAAAARAPRGWRRGVGLVVTLGLVFQFLITYDIVGKRIDNASRALSTHFLFAVSLTALVAALMLRRSPGAARGAGNAPDPRDPLGVWDAVPLNREGSPALR